MSTKKKTAKVMDENTVSLSSISIFDLEEKSVIVTPQEKMHKPLPKVSGMGRGEWLADGTFTWMKRGWQRTHSILIKKTNHGKLVRTKDGYLRAYLGTKISDGEDFKKILAEEVKEMINSLNNSPLPPSKGRR